jgi:hypothetical protein
MVGKKNSKSRKSTPKSADSASQERPETNAPAEQRPWTIPNKGDVAGRNAGSRKPKSAGQFTGKKERNAEGKGD